MASFTIDSDNNITAHADAARAAQATGATSFDSQATLAKVSTDWPLSRLVDVWNSVPGHTPVKKFQDRKKAVARIWAAIQTLAENVAIKDSKPTGRNVEKAKKAAKKATKKTAKRAGGKTAERTNKKAEVIAMMKRPHGATLAEIMAHTDWQAHTVRGFISILGSKGGHKIESSKNADGERTYKMS